MKHSIFRPLVPALLILLTWAQVVVADDPEHSIARQWNEALLFAIRSDLARPTIHARNLHHLSSAMWDAWAAYDLYSDGLVFTEDATALDIAAARHEAISFAAYRLLKHRFANSEGAAASLPHFDALMDSLGYDKDFVSTAGPTAAALGNRVAAAYIAYGLADGANEAEDYDNQFYVEVNPPMLPEMPGNDELMIDPNRWQPLFVEFWCDQLGGFCFIFEDPLPFLSPEWGQVIPFALGPEHLTIHPAPDDNEWWVYMDPGPPPYLGGVGDQEYKDEFADVIEASGWLDPADGVMIDISPASMGNNPIGTNDGTGYPVNPINGEPYQPQWVPRADYYRVLAEFWADGPQSSTPPGHWFEILNYVSDHPLLEKRWGGEGPELDDLEWDVRSYLALGGAVHDAAVACWSVKGYYDYVRPMSAIRYMAEHGQSSDPGQPSYHPEGLPIRPGVIEVITEQSSAPGKRHEHLADYVGEIAGYAWRGHVEDPTFEVGGVGWIRAKLWWPYQKINFITPPFAGYTSGHSTFSRAAAEALTRITGSEYFPGGLGEFLAPAGEFLEFEYGPSIDIVLQWARYADAADESGISRIYGGIHPSIDDIPARLMGYEIGPLAFERADQLITGDRIFIDAFGSAP